MPPLLGRPAPTRASSSRHAVRAAGTIVMGLAIMAAFYKLIVRLESIIHAAPALTPLLPATAIAGLAILLPLGVFLGCQAEFEGGVVPWTPGGYAVIARRTYAAFAANAATSGRVEGKDL